MSFIMIMNTDFIYPIGAIYISTSSINPSTLFGGTWESIQGRFLLAGGKPSQNTNTNHGSINNDELSWNFSYGQTLGEFRHQLNVNELPSHTHGACMYGTTPGGGTTSGYAVSGGTGAVNYWGVNGNTGGNLVHNNIPPCLVVYMWRRTA